MKNDMNHLVDTLREIAYDAGFALLSPVDALTTRRYAERYNDVYGQLREVAPSLTTAIRPLPAEATVGSIRIAARAAVAHAQRVPTPCFQRIAA